MAVFLSCFQAGAGIIRIEITTSQSPAFGGKTFGNTGAYEKLAVSTPGVLTGVVPPAALGWPAIPGVAYTGLVTIRHCFNYGPQFYKGIIAQYPLQPGNEPAYINFVSRVD